MRFFNHPGATASARVPRALLLAILFAISIVIGLYSLPRPAHADASPTFASRRTFGTGQDTTYSVALGDIDNDGKLDLIIGNSGRQSLVYLNQGQGIFYNGPVDCALTQFMRCFGGASDDTRSVAVGDMNGDGRLDIVVGNNGQQSAVYLNNLLGSFPITRPFGGPTNATSSLALGDVNSDGRLDIVAGRSGQQSAIYINDATNSFATVRPFGGATDATTGVALGDIDGDGLLDMAVGISGQNSVIYENFGGGLLFAVINLPVANTQSVAFADINGDGYLDLAVGNSGQRSFLFINRGPTLLPAGFEIPPAPFPIPNARSLAFGDVNGDGAVDLAIGSATATGGSDPVPNVVLLNDRSGIAYAVPTLGNAGRSVAFGDVTGDGYVDLVIGTTGQDSIYINNAVGGVTRTWFENTPETGAYTRLFGSPADIASSVAAGDLNSDGALDIVAGNRGQPSKVYLNDRAGNFPTGVAFSAADATSSVALGDLNSDGALDIVAGNRGQPSKVYLNDRAGGFPTGVAFSAADATSSVALGDLNNDGALDIVAGNSGQPSKVYLNDRAGHFPVARPFGPASGAATSVALSDLDGDGDLDIVAASAGQNMIYLNDGAGNFASGAIDCAAPPTGARCFGPPSANASSVAVGDFNADQRPDIVAGDHVYFNDRQGHFPIGQVACGITPGVDCLDTPVTSLAVGDLNGDSRPDIMVGNTVQNVFYLNDGDGHFFSGPLTCGFVANTHCVGPGADATSSVALGDMDGDGDQDIVAGNGAQPGLLSAVYMNGMIAPTRQPDYLPSVVLARPGATAAAPLFSAPEVLGAPVIPISYTLSEPTGLPARFIRAQFSTDGGGTWRDAVAATGTITSNLSTRIPENYTSADVLPVPINDASTANATLFIPTTQSIADLDVWLNIAHPINAGLTISLVSPSGTVVELARGLSGVNLTNTTLDDQAAAPITSGVAPYTGRFQPVGSLAALNGQRAYGTWQLRVTDGQTDTLVGQIDSWGIRLRTPQANSGVHVYNWDVLGSNVFGQSDNVIFRIAAYPSQRSDPNTVAGPFELAYLAGQTPPFRVRGSQVRVISDTLPVAGALVYHLPAGQLGRAQPYSDLTGLPFRTDSAGYLQGSGTLAVSASLVALLPVVISDTYTVYYTSAQPIPTGLASNVVQHTGVQTLTVSSAHPLILFNLKVSLEWDARNDEQFMARLRSDLQRTSEFLYDWSDGQIALGQISIYQNREQWDDAAIRIYATNRMRPIASQGGIVSTLVTDPLSPTNTYEPGQIHIGAIWNRFGQTGGNLGEDWPRTLAHEIGHFALYLNDNYIGLDSLGRLKPVTTCASPMSDPYRDDYSEFHPTFGWQADCAQTLSNQATGRSDWATIATFYHWVHQPLALADINPGPNNLPLAVTAIQSVDPITPTTALPVPIYNIRRNGAVYQPSAGARAFMFQGNDRLIDLGQPRFDQVLARGAHPGDRICVYELAVARLGCTIASATNEQLPLDDRADWQPDVSITPVTSVTLAISVTNIAAALPLKAQLFPLSDQPSQSINLTRDAATGTYFGNFVSNESVPEGYVRVWVEGPGPLREVVTDYAVGGSPGFRRGHGGFRRGHGGFRRGHGAPTASSDGQVLLIGDDLDLQPGQFFVLQAATTPPPPPPWATMVGQAFHLTGSVTATAVLSGTSISFSYLSSELAPGEEDGLRVYRLEDRVPARCPQQQLPCWLPLDTQSDLNSSTASALIPGPGLYALMSSVAVSLDHAGWNLFAYSVKATQPISTALQSIDGIYTTVYGYDASNPANPWRVYDPSAPAWVNDLAQLEYGHGYWINVTRPTTLLLKGSGSPQAGARLARVDSVPTPPATYYGQVRPSDVLSPQSGMPVTAGITGHQCGQSATQTISGQIVYKVYVSAAEGDLADCGVPRRLVTFQVGGRAMTPSVPWDNGQVSHVDLIATGSTSHVYLPVMRK